MKVRMPSPHLIDKWHNKQNNTILDFFVFDHLFGGTYFHPSRLSRPCLSSCGLTHYLCRLTGFLAINGKQAIYEPFKVIYIQA